MLIITEETPGVGLPVMTAFENTCTGGHNLIYALGNPDNQTDTLRTFCKTKSVKSFRVSALDFPNIVLGSELVKGAVTKESIDRRIDTYGLDSDFYKSRVRGISPEQSTDSLIRLDWIEACCIEEEVVEGVGAVGIDVANSETGDKAALAWGRGNTLVDLQEFQCPNATHLAYNLLYTDFELVEKGYLNYKTPKLTTHNVKPNYIGVDGVGVGVSTVNAFHDKGKEAVSLQGGALAKAIPTDKEGKPLYGFVNLRSQMYWELREDLRHGAVRFALRSKQLLRLLVSELVIPKVEMKGKIAVESKDNIKKRLGHSPNLADAVAYWNWIRKGYYKTKKVPLKFGT